MQLIILILCLLAAFSTTTHAHNITRILANHPSFSTFNHYLTVTHLAGEINRRRTITVCAVDNAAMNDLLAKHYSLPTLKNILSLHVFADYFGAKKLHQISKGSTTTSSLFQATGEAAGTSGYVNITDMKGGKVGFSCWKTGTIQGCSDKKRYHSGLISHHITFKFQPPVLPSDHRRCHLNALPSLPNRLLVAIYRRICPNPSPKSDCRCPAADLHKRRESRRYSPTFSLKLVDVALITFPGREAGLPDGCENLSSVTTSQMSLDFHKAMDLMQQPVEEILRQGNPNCIISGALFWWTTALALRYKIPRIVFYGEVRFSKLQLPEHLLKLDDHEDPLTELVKKVLPADEAGYGIIVNSFLELEPDYAAYYRKIISNKAWHIGPVSLINNTDADKSHRGEEISTQNNPDCFSWLNFKKPNSVLYICFGSMAIVQKDQLHEIAIAIGSSERKEGERD